MHGCVTESQLKQLDCEHRVKLQILDLDLYLNLR